MIDDVKKETEQAVPEEGPQPITFTATYYPDGRLHIECPLMANPMLMLGFLVMITDGTKNIMEDKGQREQPQIHQPRGSFLDGLRKFKR